MLYDRNPGTLQIFTGKQKIISVFFILRLTLTVNTRCRDSEKRLRNVLYCVCTLNVFCDFLVNIVERKTWDHGRIAPALKSASVPNVCTMVDRTPL